MQKDPWIRRNSHFSHIHRLILSVIHYLCLPPPFYCPQERKAVRCPHRSVTLPPWCSGTPPEKSPTPNLSKPQEQKSPNRIESKDKISVNNGGLESRIRVRVFRCTDEGSAGGEIGGSEGREMSLTAAAAEEQSPTPSAAAAEIHLPAEVDWEMLDKSRFFVLGAALFSGVSFALYPAVVLKTRLQVSRPPLTCTAVCASILRREGPIGFYRGFATSLTGTIPARALYMAALEVTKSAVGAAAVKFGVPDPAAAAAANAAAGLSAAVAAQIVWTPIDVISQRLMVRDSKYTGGIDAVKKIVRSDGIRGLYRGFGMSILTYAPSNAVWWASYSVSQRAIWGGIGYYFSHFAPRRRRETNGDGDGGVFRPNYATVAAVQGASAAMAGGAAAVVTMPLDTIKTRMQVMDSEEGGKSIGRTVRVLLKEGGWGACYRGLGPRWASMSLSATTMITTYEFLKRLSAKNQDFSSL